MSAHAHVRERPHLHLVEPAGEAEHVPEPADFTFKTRDDGSSGLTIVYAEWRGLNMGFWVMPLEAAGTLQRSFNAAAMCTVEWQHTGTPPTFQ